MAVIAAMKVDEPLAVMNVPALPALPVNATTTITLVAAVVWLRSLPVQCCSMARLMPMANAVIDVVVLAVVYTLRLIA